jgi:phosphoglycolate phosphatase
MTLPPAGFDLDGTLIDSRPVIMASFDGLVADTGVGIDLDAVHRRLGIKLQDELAYWFPPDGIEAAVSVYRTHYSRLLAELTTSMPGAEQALAAVRAAGARVVVITAKYGVTAQLSLDSTGLSADELVSEMHGQEKAAVLAAVGAGVYVGDTPPDMLAAVTAGVPGVGVTTGSFTAQELREAGAAHVLASLTEFPALYRKITS